MTDTEQYSAEIHRLLAERVCSIQHRSVIFKGPAFLMEFGDPVCAKTIISGPLRSGWDEPKRNRQRGYMRERREWAWELKLRFDRHVNLEPLERSFADDPPRVPRDTAHTQQADALLMDASYINPPMADPSSGTQATYTFKIVLTPV